MKVAFGLFVAALIAAGVAPANAQDVGQHPAIFAPRQLPGIDPNTFIVGHPASPSTSGAHDEHTHLLHPAVRASRAGAAQIDPNTFVVQPPATTQWSRGPTATDNEPVARTALNTR